MHRRGRDDHRPSSGSSGQYPRGQGSRQDSNPGNRLDQLLEGESRSRGGSRMESSHRSPSHADADRMNKDQMRRLVQQGRVMTVDAVSKSRSRPREDERDQYRGDERQDYRIRGGRDSVGEVGYGRGRTPPRDSEPHPGYSPRRIDRGGYDQNLKRNANYDRHSDGIREGMRRDDRGYDGVRDDMRRDDQPRGRVHSQDVFRDRVDGRMGDDRMRQEYYGRPEHRSDARATVQSTDMRGEHRPEIRDFRIRGNGGGG